MTHSSETLPKRSYPGIWRAGFVSGINGWKNKQHFYIDGTYAGRMRQLAYKVGYLDGKDRRFELAQRKIHNPQPSLEV